MNLQIAPGKNGPKSKAGLDKYCIRQASILQGDAVLLNSRILSRLPKTQIWSLSSI